MFDTFQKRMRDSQFSQAKISITEDLPAIIEKNSTYRSNIPRQAKSRLNVKGILTD